jgi:hypothetical protein
MADSVRLAMPAQTLSRPNTISNAVAVPWYIWSAVLAVTSTTVGLYWDICWHVSIGRDSFWTPAHMAIQFGAVLTGLSCAYLILHTTFAGSTEDRESSVKIWGFRGPLGAFMAAWGGFAMLTSAPFDNWWHDSFGLDVKILSPPHVLLIIGIFTMGLGGLVLIVGRMNVSVEDAHRKMGWALLYVGSLLLSLLMMLGYEYVGDQTLMHSAIFYRVVGMAAPLVLVGVGRASGHRWAATTLSVFYTVLWLAGLWIMPLFPAQAKLGPVFTEITHMTPLQFPVLLIPAAAAVDWLLNRLRDRGTILQSVAAGSAFLAVLVAVQWPFSILLLSTLGRNWFFGSMYFGYSDRPSNYHLTWQFSAYEKTRAEFWTGMAIALAVTIIATRIGIVWGDWMRRIRR